MTDPAISAAQRALAEIGTGMSRTFTAEAAAREMAKSVQELHKPGPISGFSGSWMTGAKEECTTCRRGWPCETAKRVYPSEELGL